MSRLSLAEFADRLTEIMPLVMREFLKHQTKEFYRLKVTMPQAVILDFLYKKGEAKMTEIAAFIHVTTAATTGLVDRLVRDGYVIRVPDPADRRVVRVSLTSKGMRTITDIVECRKEMIIRMFGVVSQEEREEYLRILTRIYEHLGA